MFGIQFLNLILDFFRDGLIFLQIIIVLIFIFSSRKKNLLIQFILILIFGFLLSQFFKSFFPTLRPISFYSNQKLFGDFPSRHTLISFALTLFLISQNFKLGILSLLLTFLIAILSYLSLMHSPLAIFFGFILGYLVFIFVKILSNLWERFNFQKREEKI